MYMYLYIYVCVCLYHYEYTSTKQTHDHFEQQLYTIPYTYILKCTYTLYTYTLYTRFTTKEAIDIFTLSESTDSSPPTFPSHTCNAFLVLPPPSHTHTYTHYRPFDMPRFGIRFKILDG